MGSGATILAAPRIHLVCPSTSVGLRAACMLASQAQPLPLREASRKAEPPQLEQGDWGVALSSWPSLPQVCLASSGVPSLWGRPVKKPRNSFGAPAWWTPKLHVW